MPGMDPGVKLPSPCLCLVTDRRQCEGRPLVDVVAQAVSGGVGMVQLRERDLPASQLYDLGLELREVTKGRALLFINDRVDVAMACGADGVQLGEEGLPTEKARELTGGKLLLGRSVHSVAGAKRAQDSGADMAVLGTIFASGSHPGVETGGLDRVRDVTSRVGIPVLGIGGITAKNVGAAIEAGASGAAVITAITRSADPKSATTELIEEMDRIWAATDSSRVARQV